MEFGSGSWGRLFTYAANLPKSKVHYAGKPDAAFFTPLVQALHLDPKRCLMVGDNLESDILGGIHAGMHTALVLTGVATPDHVAEKPPSGRTRYLQACRSCCKPWGKRGHAPPRTTGNYNRDSFGSGRYTRG